MTRYFSKFLWGHTTLVCAGLFWLVLACGDDLVRQRQQVTLAFEAAQARVAQTRDALAAAQIRADEALAEVESLEPELRAAEVELRSIRVRLRELGAAEQETLKSEIDDAELFRLVQRELLEAPVLSQVAVTAQVLGGSVVLHGTVPDEAIRAAAAEIAASIPGVEALENLIEVKPDFR